MDTAKATNTKRGRDLLDDGLFDRLARSIESEHHLDADTAARCVDQAAAYLAACATTTEPLAPSMAADIGWHTFILHTIDYAAFCDQVAGHFIHHVPTDEHQGHSDEAIQAVLDATTAAIRSAGFHVESGLWKVNGDLKCNQCHSGCADDPPPVPPFTEG